MTAELATVVVVDDAPEVRALVKTRLRLSGAFRVVGEAADGIGAVALAEEHRPSLMVLDVSMPGMDGLEALPLVLAASPETRVVFFSGFEEQGLVDEAKRLGAAGFVEKSERVESLVERLTSVLNSPPTSYDGHHVTGTEHDSAGDADDQAMLDEHLERFREVFDEAAIGMATMTLAGRVVRANRAMGSVLNRRESELVGQFYGDLTDGQHELLSAVLDDIRRRPLDVAQLEHGVTGSPTKVQVRSTLAPVRDSAGRALYVFLQVQDVTRERAAVEELRQSEERFRLLVETVQDYAIFMLTPTGEIASWNAGAQRSKGYTADEIIGQHFRVFYPPAQQESRHPEHELELALRDGHYEEEGWRVRKDGTQFWANVLITAVHNQAGEHVGFAKVTRDTSERRALEEERERTSRALARANEELESANARLRKAAEDQAQFVAVTAHELRTPVGVLGGSADLLARHWTELTEEERDEQLAAMATSTSRLRRLLSDLLTAARLEASALELRLEQVSVRSAVAAAVATAQRTREGAEVHVDELPDVWVLADADRLAQALDNLVGNALRHGVPPAQVSVVADGDTVDVRVSDAGQGVSAVVRERLFERFATGRRQGGTGLGLFIVRELARAQHGEAFYEPPSAKHPSGVFVVRMPRA